MDPTASPPSTEESARAGAATDAHAAFTQTLDDRRRALLGPDHPATVAARNDLGVLLRKNGRYAEAESIFRDVFAAHKRRHGREHPRTAVVMSNWAQTLAAQGRYEAADSLYRQSWPCTGGSSALITRG